MWVVVLVGFIMISTYLLIQNHIIEGPKTLTHMDELQGITKLLSASQKYQDSAEEQKDVYPEKPSGLKPESKSEEVLRKVLGGHYKTTAGERHAINDAEVVCDDPVWCHISPPKESYYGFDDPGMDQRRWKMAQKLASEGANVFIERIVKVHTSPYYYIDGDRIFRNLQPLVDVFTDLKTGLDPLLPGNEHSFSPVRRRRLNAEADAEPETGAEEMRKIRMGRENSLRASESKRRLQENKIAELETTKALSVRGKQVVPSPYNFRVSDRAPVVEMGYTAFDKNMNTYFSGNFLGGNFVKREWWFDQWARVRDKLDFPFITMCSLNENWGPLSTNFPNRTAGWGACCNKPSQRIIHEFLNHDKTLMLVINQHSNLSHPKMLTLPRGLPLTWEHTSKVVWDSQRYNLHHVKKEVLLFAAASSWGKRPQILRCISDKMSRNDFEGHSDTPPEQLAKMKTDRRHYYRKLGRAMFGVALPGLGYDCFRTWELLTMGTIVVIERGVGLDRTLWRLPALLVDDFYDINPEMLRQAYVEAVYHRDDFEYERLSQSFWYEVIYNVSAAKSTQPLLDKFPMRAEKRNFARPKEPYDCWKTDSCGPGTKRTPRNYC